MGYLALGELDISKLNTDRVQEEFYDSSFAVGGSFGVRVNKSGRKSFFVIYPIGGRRKRMTLGTFPLISYLQAKEYAVAVMGQAAAGHDPKAKIKSGHSARNFHELCDRFISEYALAECNPKTVAEYRRIISKELLPAWAETYPASIKSEDVTALIRRIELNRKKLTMAVRTRALISNIFNFAIERGIVSANPVPQTNLQTKIQRQPRILSPTEIAALWQALDAEDVRTASAFKLLLLTGQRPGDVLAMRWDALAFTVWKITGSGGTKREVFLSPPTMRVLEVLHENTGDEEYVFSGKRGEHLQYIAKAAKRIATRMQVDEPWSPADLRTTVEANLRTLNLHPRVIDHVLNRTSTSRKVSSAKEVTFSDIKGALTLWGQRVIEIVAPSPRPSEDNKVVKLFR